MARRVETQQVQYLAMIWRGRGHPWHASGQQRQARASLQRQEDVPGVMADEDKFNNGKEVTYNVELYWLLVTMQRDDSIR